MVLKLYYNEMSPAVRATLLTIKALEIDDVELVTINLATKEQLEPFYLKLNPLHTIPTLQDGDFLLFDSHAINNYLVDKYGKSDSLYPKNLEKRAIVEQRQHFDCGILFPRMGSIVKSLLTGAAKTVTKDKADLLVEGYSSLEKLLEGRTYATGDQVTVADFSLIATITSSNVFVPIASNRYPKIVEWISKMQQLPYYAEANQAGLDKFTAVMKTLLG